MVSDNVLRARQIIAKYSEVFESLMEFERTKKLPKLYRRKRLNITIDENVLRDFKKYCGKNGINMSRWLERKMVDAVKTA
ncbi:MAG: hypothetical protein QS98_C0007G0016 [archaeon GW2011_AR3]|nr:MAG: hypothetical protein QS98_C0007G0016 [archaeon GW2011_AR3]MBS3108927.1 hypothetical protein [Candidatus Woesearchaeota archaeon]